MHNYRPTVIFTPRPLSQEGYLKGCPLRAPLSAASFGYCSNMVQQIEFIMHTNTNSQPLEVNSQG